MPQEKLNKLFPERWVPEPDNIIKEAERMAALENPNITIRTHSSGLFTL